MLTNVEATAVQSVDIQSASPGKEAGTVSWGQLLLSRAEDHLLHLVAGALNRPSPNPAIDQHLSLKSAAVPNEPDLQLVDIRTSQPVQPEFFDSKGTLRRIIDNVRLAQETCPRLGQGLVWMITVAELQGINVGKVVQQSFAAQLDQEARTEAWGQASQQLMRALEGGKRIHGQNDGAHGSKKATYAQRYGVGSVGGLLSTHEKG